MRIINRSNQQNRLVSILRVSSMLAKRKTMKSSLPEQIETERLLVRVARPGDGRAFNAAIHRSLERLAPWLAWVTPPPTPEQSEASCCRAYARFLLNEDLMAIFIDKMSGSMNHQSLASRDHAEPSTENSRRDRARCHCRTNS
jgi:hypothetical protein